MYSFKKKNLPIPDSAKAVHKEIVALLKKLLALEVQSPLHPDFISMYNKFLMLFHHYQDEIVKGYRKEVTCKKSCMYCCYHWVEDVYSFEAEIIAHYIKKHFPKKISTIIDKFSENERHLINLNNIMEQKLIENRREKEVSDIDSTDLLLASYYQLKRPCALLSDNGLCIIYKVRPLTCRIYISFSDPHHCNPEYIDKSNIPTFLLDMEENASDMLDMLHDKYDRFNKTGLPVLLIEYLST